MTSNFDKDVEMNKIMSTLENYRAALLLEAEGRMNVDHLGTVYVLIEMLNRLDIGLLDYMKGGD